MSDIQDKKIKNPDTGREIKVSSALNYPHDEKVYQIAKNLLDKTDKSTKKRKSFKPKVDKKRHDKKTNKFIQKYGKYKLNVFPPDDLDESKVIVNMKGNINTHAVLSWRDQKSGRMVNAYTRKFLKANAKIKWKRVKKLNETKINKILNNSVNLLKNRKKEISDSAAQIALISMTGLRVGEHQNYNLTKNRGIMTLGPDNVKIEGEKIILNFVGKSYQENNAEINNKQLAEYLKNKINKNKDKEFIFENNYLDLNKTFDKIAGNKFKIKDLRTYTATKMAADILAKVKIDLPEKDSQIKKVLKENLKDVFEKVSERLNNTPAMAKNSYVHPEVINNWLKSMNIKKEISDQVYKESSEIKKQKILISNDFDNCDEYTLPDWWNNNNIKLKYE